MQRAIGLAGLQPPRALASSHAALSTSSLKRIFWSEMRRLGIALDIVENLIALGEMMVPIVINGEGVGVEMVGGVDAATRIAVLVPGAADGVILLDDGEGDPRFLQLDAHGNARETRADDQCLKMPQRLGRR